MPINNYGALKRHFVRNTQNNSNGFPKFILIDGINNRLNDNKRSVKGQKKYQTPSPDSNILLISKKCENVDE